jgi:hypothetical protein
VQTGRPAKCRNGQKNEPVTFAKSGALEWMDEARATSDAGLQVVMEGYVYANVYTFYQYCLHAAFGWMATASVRVVTSKEPCSFRCCQQEVVYSRNGC